MNILPFTLIMAVFYIIWLIKFPQEMFEAMLFKHDNEHKLVCAFIAIWVWLGLFSFAYVMWYFATLLPPMGGA